MQTATPANTNLPTEVQLRTLQVIVTFRDETGMSPTLKEIAALTGKTRQRISVECRALHRKGLIHSIKYGHRSITVDPKVERSVRRSMKGKAA